MLVSVVIPTYNGAEYLGQAIQSILDQTHQDFEIVIVDDASPDNTAAIVAQYADPRIRYLRHPVNQGAVPARNTGVLAARGDFIAFLDQDDFYHPDKLAAHVAYLAANPEIGASYNARFELHHSSEDIRTIWRVGHPVTLESLVMGFPISPSDLVLRREWAVRTDLWDPQNLFHGGEIVSNGLLYLAGCKFGGIDQALNFRRNHSGRRIRNIAHCCDSYLAAQNAIFADPRCPAEVKALAPQAHAGSYLVWASYALEQEETALGQQYLRYAVVLDPTYLEGDPCHVLRFLMTHSIWDENRDHAVLLRTMCDQLPPELASLRSRLPWAIARGYLIRATLCLTWGRYAAAEAHFAQARAAGAQMDEDFVNDLAYQLVSYEIQYGSGPAAAVLNRLAFDLEEIGPKACVRHLHTSYAAQCAFRHYAAGRYDLVPRDVLQTMIGEPRNMANRGMLALLWRSVSKPKTASSAAQ